MSRCGKETTTTKSEDENKQDHNTSSQETKSSGEIQAEYLAEQNAKLKIKTVDEKSYGLHDPDTDDNTISYFAVIKNESKRSVDVSEINSTSPKISNEDLAKAETYEVFAYTYPNKD
ncbi:hypothetical protein [Priestia megaterium]|uniref:hypothetical protein n=1 Tax=Priestia megaterium TaxID=1404 RepID=UPI0031733189